MWKEPNPAPADVAAFMECVKKAKIGPVFVHGNYLVNLASASEVNLAKSMDNLRRPVLLSDSIEASGLIFHPGSAGQASYDDALDKVLRSLHSVLSDYNGSCKLLLEVCAGQGQTIGDKFSEFGDIINRLDRDKRLGVCWDTCHLFNAARGRAEPGGRCRPP